MGVQNSMKLPINEIKPNNSNPRIIKDKQFKDLVQSLKDFPEMAEVREVVLNKDHIILGGNMRYQAAVEAGWSEIPVKIVDWPEDKQREFIIKDNNNAGEWDWDILANEWDAMQLGSWGVENKTWDTNYNPALEPNFDTNQVTEDDIDKKAKELAEQMIKQRQNIQCICPNCGEEFEVQA